MYRKVKVKPILELIYAKQSNSQIADALKVSRITVIKIRNKNLELNLPIEEVRKMTDEEIYEVFCPNAFKRKTNYVPIDPVYIHEELKKVGVTMLLLWEEYMFSCKAKGKEYCSYPTFCLLYRKYRVKKSFTNHIKRKPGDLTINKSSKN